MWKIWIENVINEGSHYRERSENERAVGQQIIDNEWFNVDWEPDQDTKLPARIVKKFRGKETKTEVI